LMEEIAQLNEKSIDDLLRDRYERLMSYGKFSEE